MKLTLCLSRIHWQRGRGNNTEAESTEYQRYHTGNSERRAESWEAGVAGAEWARF